MVDNVDVTREVNPGLSMCRQVHSKIAYEALPILRESPKSLTKEQIRSLKAMCKWDLRFLCVEFLKYNEWDICHDELIEALDKGDFGRYKLFLFPRGHLKSSIITVGRSVQKLLQKPNIRVLIANAIWDNARGFLEEIQRYLTDCSDLPLLFGQFKPKTRGSIWNKDSITILQRTIPKAAASITTTGIERTQASQHYDYIILDDVVARENCSTKEQREKVKKFYKDCLSLLEPDGEIVVIGTTWHEDDLYNDLRNNKKYKVYVRTALEPPNFKLGRVIFPKKFSHASLQDVKEELGPFEFSAQYFLNPYPEEDMEFKKSWFKYFKEPPKEPMYVTMVLDPSLGKDTSDYAGLVTTGITKDGSKYILDARHFKCKVDLLAGELVTHIRQLQIQGIQINTFGLESFAFQQVLEMPIRRGFEANKITIPIELIPVTTKFSKDSRIRALIPHFANGSVWLKEDQLDLMEELLRWKPDTKNKSDDILDALAHHISFWQRKPTENTQIIEQMFSLNWWMKQNQQNKKKDIFDDYR